MAELTESALASLRREAVKYRAVRVGSFMEGTPEGLWLADEQRYDDDLQRKIDKGMYAIERDYERRLMHEMFFGPDVPYVPPREPVDDWQTPESFFNCELRSF